MDRLKPVAAGALQEPPCLGTGLPALFAPPEAAQPSVHERMARIVRTIEADIIPRLVRAHRPVAEPQPATPLPPVDDAFVRRFVERVLADDESAYTQELVGLRQAGVTVEALFLEVLAPAARLLGRMWEDDEALFSDVTVAVGRLQRLMRGLSPAFGLEVECPPDGRRVLLLPAPGEQHTFGLSMVAEFFRRAGWDVVCDLDGHALDPVTLVRQEWFDVVGLSVGVDARLDWLESGISAVARCVAQPRRRGAGRRPGVRGRSVPRAARRCRRHGARRPRSAAGGRATAARARPPALSRAGPCTIDRRSRRSFESRGPSS